MSLPIIQLGQCGNQIGSSFFDILYDSATKSSPGHQAMLSSFFYPSTSPHKPWKAKAFQIDMEPKVVNKNLNMKKNWSYSQKLSLIQQQGSGNNWAYGCNIHGPNVRPQLEELFRQFVQKQDYIKAFLQIQSMAGGTGSGLGTYISQLLCDLYPKTPKFACCIMPHLSGEVILQCYNASLSVGSMYQLCDGIFIIENDEINNICLKELKIQKNSLDDINQVIGRNLASTFFPMINKNQSKVFSIEENGFNYGVDLVENLFYDNRYKLASIKTSPNGPKNSQPFNYDSWQAIENDLTYKKFNKVKARMMIYRGPDHPNEEQIKGNAQICGNNGKSHGGSGGGSGGLSCEILLDKHCFYKYNRSITLVENSDKFNPAFEQILERSYNMFNNQSYLYQYHKYGLENQKFLECFSTIENLIQNYSKI